MGADVLECDARLTRDGALVLAHDGVVGRGSAATRIAWETEAHLRARDPELLTLAELLALVRAHDVLLNVDLKSPNAEVPLVGMLAAHDLIGRTIITSRAAYQLRRLRALAPGLRLGLSKGSGPPPGLRGLPEFAALLIQRTLLPRRLPSILRNTGADAAYMQHQFITPYLVAALHDAGLGIAAWTVDDIAVAQRLIGWGVDGITTNRPDRMRPLVRVSASGGTNGRGDTHGNHDSH